MMVSFILPVSVEAVCSTRPPQISPSFINPITWPGLREQQYAVFYANRDSLDCEPAPIRIEIDIPDEWPSHLTPAETLVLPPGSNLNDYWKNIVFSVPETARAQRNIPVTFRAINETSGEVKQQIVYIQVQIKPFISGITPMSAIVGKTQITLTGSDFSRFPTIAIVANNTQGYAYIPATSSNGREVSFRIPSTILTFDGETIPTPPGNYVVTLQNSDRLWASNLQTFTVTN